MLTTNSNKSQAVVPPRRLGVAADLVFIERSPARYILNALLVYDQIVLPINAMVMGRLLTDFSGAQLKRLLVGGRLVFCPEVTASHALLKDPVAFSRPAFLASLDRDIRHPDDKAMGLLHVIDEHLLVGDYGDYSAWRTLHDEAVDAFFAVAKRKGYEGLLPAATPFFSRMDRVVGLETGLARINDLVSAGVTDLQLDKELPILLEVCFPAHSPVAAAAPGAIERDALQAVENLHSIQGLPLLSPREATYFDDVDRMIDVALSDEAAELRGWLREKWCPGFDVREHYLQTQRALPSKESWTGWLKFGVVTGASTAIGNLAGDPGLGFLAGAAIGVFDQEFGQRSIEKLLDPYHPSRWLSYVETGVPPTLLTSAS